MTPKKESGRGRHEGFRADVVVVGGGPGGAVSAKYCAQHGLRTILLERKKLPRHKVCGGIIVSNLARVIVEREFGVIPEWVLNDPPYRSISILHLSNSGKSQDLQLPAPERPMPLTLRRDLDYWMVQKAREAGAEIWDEAVVTDIIQESSGITLKIRRTQEEQEQQARFVIGADGAVSIIRKRLYPDLNVHYSYHFQEFHPGALETIDRRYYHFFSFDTSGTPNISDCFGVGHGRDFFGITVDDMIRPVKEAMSLAKVILTQKWGFDPNSRPIFSGGCAVAALLENLYSGRFIPAKGNILLVGDAAGLAIPTDKGGDNKAKGEGVNTALKSGILAARSIVKAASSSQEAATVYFD